MDTINLDKKRVKKVLTKVLKNKSRQLLPPSRYYKLSEKIRIDVTPKNKTFWRVESTEDCVRISYSCDIKADWNKILTSKNQSAIIAYNNITQFQNKFREEIKRILDKMGMNEGKNWWEMKINPPLISVSSICVRNNSLRYENPIFLKSKIEEIKVAIKGMTLTSPKFESFPAKELIHSIRVESDCTKFLVRISLNKSNPHHLSITPWGIIKQLQRNHPKLGTFVKIK